MIDEQKEMNHMRELVELLNRARRSYEQENTEIMSNYEYDKLYDELLELEEKLGTRMANSPTVNVDMKCSVSSRKSVMSVRCFPG